MGKYNRFSAKSSDDLRDSQALILISTRRKTGRKMLKIQNCQKFPIIYTFIDDFKRIFIMKSKYYSIFTILIECSVKAIDNNT